MKLQSGIGVFYAIRPGNGSFLQLLRLHGALFLRMVQCVRQEMTRVQQTVNSVFKHLLSITYLDHQSSHHLFTTYN